MLILEPLLNGLLSCQGLGRTLLREPGMEHKGTIATESRVKEFDHHKRVIAEKLAKEMKDLEAVRNRIQSLKLEVTAQAGEEGKLFGSVTALQVADLLAQKGYQIDRRTN